MILSTLARRCRATSRLFSSVPQRGVPQGIFVSLYGGRLPLNAVGSVALVGDRVVVTPYDSNTSRDIRASLAEALPANRRVFYDSKSGQVVVAPADEPRRAKQAREPRTPRAVELDEDLEALAEEVTVFGNEWADIAKGGHSVELSASSEGPARRRSTRRARTKVSKRERRGDELDFRFERRAAGGSKTRRQLDKLAVRRYEYVESHAVVEEEEEEAL